MPFRAHHRSDAELRGGGRVEETANLRSPEPRVLELRSFLSPLYWEIRAAKPVATPRHEESA